MSMRRSRLRIEVPPDVIRAVRGRAGEEGVRVHDVVTAALAAYCREHLARVRKRSADGRDPAGPRRTSR